MGKSSRKSPLTKWSDHSRYLYSEWRKYHAGMRWVFREFIAEVERESRRHKGPISAKKIVEKMKDKPRHAISRRRLQMNSNHVPFYSAFYTVLFEDKRSDIVKRIIRYRSRHDPEGQIRAWLKMPKAEAVQEQMRFEEAPKPNKNVEGHY